MRISIIHETTAGEKSIRKELVIESEREEPISQNEIAALFNAVIDGTIEPTTP